ncbi:MAG: hydrogenase iron-sulfur subunit [Magnetococcales bacterium]|nr:hydrogenase iron-sulfur subunit [Magnetococcales bacterium]
MRPIRKAGDALFLRLEGWFNRTFGNHLNPFYHLGSLTFFFFWVVLVSGIYVFIFFETRVDHAFNSVEYMTHDQWWLAGIMRSLHRYASDAAVITIFLHMFREFFRDRYRGVRWFSWITGVPTLWLVVLLGISGYWLVWDMLAQYIAVVTAEMIDWLPITLGSMALNFIGDQVSDRFFTLMAFLHLLGFPVALVFLLWTHVSRISHIDFNPPKVLAWGSMVALLVLSLVKPAVSHGPADLSLAPTVLQLDWFYLNIYPVSDILGPAWAWGIPTGVTFFLMMLPWMPRKKPEPIAEVDLDYCNGCGQCGVDCPYGAVTMQPRSDGRKFLLEPTVSASLCTSCGICMGACTSSNPYRQSKGRLLTGIEMPHYSAEALRKEVTDKIAALSGKDRILVVGCDFAADPMPLETSEVAVVRLPCTAMLPPSFLDFSIRKGIDGVLVTGCRDGDCYFRFGNHITLDRISGLREPRLFGRTDQERIDVFWAAQQESSQLTDRLAEFRQRLDKIKDKPKSPKNRKEA